MSESLLVRVMSIEIENFKNVSNGLFSMPKTNDKDEFSQDADIAGIYGQNGSGKTSVIQTLSLFKNIASGNSLWADMEKVISANKEECTFKIKLAIQKSENEKYKVTYGCTISKKEEKAVFSSEKLNVSKMLEDGSWVKDKPYFECSYNDALQVFTPKNQYDELVSKNRDKIIELSVAYKMAQETNKSFLFSKEFSDILKQSPQNELGIIISIIKKYVMQKLFIILTSHSGGISLNMFMPLAFILKNQNSLSVGDIPIDLQNPTILPKAAFEMIETVISNMNCVLDALVPGLSVGFINYGEQLQENGTGGIRFELVSKRDGLQFPLRYESEGIKKIISILNVLIVMFNDPSVCVAIDELDSGVFELLLGKLLSVIEESGKGQLIFTSHNLRPLEVLNKNSIIFSSANDKNRYIKLSNIKPTNNLRDCYLRALSLEGEDEPLAVEIKESTIRRCLRKAGCHVEE